jgi:hypothetical protein
MSSKRQAVISIGLYQFIGTIDQCLAVDELMQGLSQVSNHWVHDESDNCVQDPLPNNYWTIESQPRPIQIDFVDRDLLESDVRHTKHMEYRKSRWDAEAESKTDEVTDES